VRPGPAEEERAAWMELTEGGSWWWRFTRFQRRGGSPTTSEGQGGGGVRGVHEPCSRRKGGWGLKKGSGDGASPILN
jgi:hypothetical protein